MSAFWIFGIVFNVTLTVLAIWWVVKQMRRRDDEIESDYASVRLDAYHDQQSNYEFTFNAATNPSPVGEISEKMMCPLDSPPSDACRSRMPSIT